MIADGNNRKGHIGRLCAGHVHPPDGLPGVGAVNSGRLSQGLWNGFKMLPQQENSQGASKERQHDAHLCIGQSQVSQCHKVRCDENVIWNDDLHENHGKHQGLSLKIHDSQRIGSQSGCDKLYAEGHHHQYQRIQVIPGKGNGIPHIRQIPKSKTAVGKKGHMKGRLAEGGSHQPDQRSQPHKRQGQGENGNCSAFNLFHTGSLL